MTPNTPNAPVRPDPPAANRIAVVLAVALAARCGWVLLHGSPQPPAAGLVFPDEQQYWSIAESLAAGRGLVDEFGYRATFMPLYPAFLSLFAGMSHALLAARLAQAVIGALVVVPVFLLARRLGGVRAATVAAVLAAVDPFLVFGFSHLLLTETVFTTLLCLAVYAAWPGPERGRAWAAAAGACFAACLYVRPSAAPLVVAWPVVVWLIAERNRRGLSHGLVVLLAVVVMLLPWAARNRRVLGEWRWLTTRSGISLYDGLGPRATGGSDLGYTKAMPNIQGMTETEWCSYFSGESWRLARNDPGRVLRLAWAKLKRTWSFVPNEPGSRTPARMALSAAWMTVVCVTAVAGAWRARRPRDTLLLLLPLICFTLLHMVFVGSVRYRVPAMPMLYVLSGWALVSRHPGRAVEAADG